MFRDSFSNLLWRQSVRSKMALEKVIFLILVAHSVSAFYPAEYVELSRLLGTSHLYPDESISERYETSRQDSDDFSDSEFRASETRHRNDYAPSDYSDDYDSREEYDDPQRPPHYHDHHDENDALYSSDKTDSKYKREEYFESLAKKSRSTYHSPRPYKLGLKSVEDMDVEASDPGYRMPRPDRTRRARLSDYDLYYPKRGQVNDESVRPDSRSKSYSTSKSFDDLDGFGKSPDVHGRQEFKSMAPPRSIEDYEKTSDVHRPMRHESMSKSMAPPRSVEDYGKSPDVHRPMRHESMSKSMAPPRSIEDYSASYHGRPLEFNEPIGPSTGSVYNTNTQSRYPQPDIYNQSPPPKPVRKNHRRSKFATPVMTDGSPSPSFKVPKLKDLSSSRTVASKREREFRKKSVPRKSLEPQARGAFSGDSGDEFPVVKPSGSSWGKERRRPGLFTEENRHFLSATGYGKPVREQFHEQGTSGPQSYKFGYNTGDKDNPMARYEERGPDGLVKGSYSYVDPTGKLQVVHYESHPERGFKTTL